MFPLPFPLSNLFALSLKFMVSFLKIVVSYTHRNFVNNMISQKVKPMKSHYETNHLCLWPCYVREDLSVQGMSGLTAQYQRISHSDWHYSCTNASLIWSLLGAKYCVGC